MAPSRKVQRAPFVLQASNLARAHTILGLTSFLTALVIGCTLHFKKIVKNGVAGYPQEWFPSVSATIGDWYPERSVFQILIALTSGPRFALVFLQYYVQRSTSSSLPFVVFSTGLMRTLSCGGWVYITSNDDHDAHDVFMILYIRRRRIALASSFFLSIIPMMYFFIQHKVYRIPGAYTHYAFFEWTLIFIDVLYDSVSELDFTEANLQVIISETINTINSPIQQQTAVKSGIEKAHIPNDVKRTAVKPSIDNVIIHQKSIVTRYMVTAEFLQAHRSYASFMADLYLGYLFWSIYTSLIPTLFYFSVWELGIAGAELALLAILSPGLLGIMFFRDWASLRSGRIMLHASSILGLVAYKFPKPTQRLMLVALANVLLCIEVVADWSGINGSSTYYQSIVHSGSFFGAASSFVLYSYKNWFGYAGGLGIAVFLMSIIPQIIVNTANKVYIGRTYFTAFFVTILLYLADVWTVAYAFVPGGQYLRERSDMPGPRIIRAGIWTVHFGIDNEGRDSQRAMSTLIKDMELDIVGLLETDLHRPVYGNRDLTRVMAEDIGYYVDLGPGPNQHTWGAVLLSKVEALLYCVSSKLSSNSVSYYQFDSPPSAIPSWRTRPSYLGVPGCEDPPNEGTEEDPLDRELQSIELARIMSSSYPTPVIFLGYVVTKPHAPRPSPYKIIAEDGQLHDIDESDGDRWCEYIFYRGLYRTSYLRMSRGKVTDTELQLGQFVLPRFGYNVTDDSKNARYLRVHKETMEKQHWFPMEYYGNDRDGGKNGHFYHVFGTPLYYNIPDDAVL
ncbi:hypothetical protein EW145_g7066 [Phellinidium pouzarii]|uniref:Uncharacterized protein n=1 Tax=Phellinidium pouzarii TaxID=167371 RepID=A0A4S4KPL7_9AGAM|nr:hypothetical protein EW145_g7066 [Phellinidium pouzarii]